MKTIVLATGGFDPIHSGHISYLTAAATLGDRLVVGINSDEWLSRKKGAAFMPAAERTAIVSNLIMVDQVIEFDDADGTATAAVQQVLSLYPNDQVIFVNGGDRTAENIPEQQITSDRLEFRFGVGGENKINSSSWLLREWRAPRTHRAWGYYRVLHDVAGTRVKELVVEPGQSLSMQQHQHRSEFWLVASGACMVNGRLPSGYAMPPRELKKHDQYHVPAQEWHQLTNPFDEPCHLIEIQYGSICDEADIVRVS